MGSQPRMASQRLWRVWRGPALRADHWRNGGGVTYELAIGPAGATLDAFDWRVSVAEIEGDCAFSTFGGVDRIIALVQGPTMRLTIDGTPHELSSQRPLRFAGESVTTCAVPDGPTRDLNVMTRRGRLAATMEFVDVGSAQPLATNGSDALVLLAVIGRVEVSSPSHGRVVLEAMDGVESVGPAPIGVYGAGVVAVVRVLRTAR